MALGQPTFINRHGSALEYFEAFRHESILKHFYECPIIRVSMLEGLADVSTFVQHNMKSIDTLGVCTMRGTRSGEVISSLLLRDRLKSGNATPNLALTQKNLNR